MWSPYYTPAGTAQIKSALAPLFIIISFWHGCTFVEKTQDLIKGDIDWFQGGRGDQQHFFRFQKQTTKEKTNMTSATILLIEDNPG